MDLAPYVVEAVLMEGRSYREVARAHGVSKSWVGKMVARFREGGYEALTPRSRAPRHIPHKTPLETEEAIVRIRGKLTPCRVRRRGRYHPRPPCSRRAWACPVGVDHLAHPETPRVRHTAAPQASEKLMETLRGNACPTSAGNPA